MSANSATHAPKRWNRAEVSMSIGLVSIVLFFIVSGFVSYGNIKTLDDDSAQVVRTHQVISALSDLLSLMKDAETGQRGFVITGKEEYLEPYNSALAGLDERINDLSRLVPPNSPEASRLTEMRSHIHAKLTELARVLEIRRTKGFEAAKAVIDTNRGKAEMDALRNQVQASARDEQLRRDQRITEMNDAYRVALTTGILTSILGVLLSGVVSVLVRRATALREREEWLQTGQVGLSNAMFGEQRIEQLGDSILSFLSEYLDAQAGVFFARDGQEYRRVAGYGLTENGSSPERIVLGEGLLGQALKDNRTFVIHDVPEGYLSVSSALGSGTPRHLVIAPSDVDGRSNGVLELGFIHPVGQLTKELLERAAEPIGLAVRSANDRSRLQDLNEETLRQNEELQAQSEELRVANEELEEQGRALKESQARLELQQVELEQSNAQLEEQTQILETQRDNLEDVKIELERRAKEVEQASRYKSDFLANMSHELRTPLNSSLILAGLLADNREGNLSDEQVRYAQTIQSAGNDLLTLINDILDLSKIESGHMEVQVRELRLNDLLDNLRRTFQPLAAQKKLAVKVEMAAGSPSKIITDGQRLEQVLKNLLSNAVKFTEKGDVALTVSAASGDRISFAVTDTGIGIAQEQQEMVFEAFRQADGTTNRRYGGTGLGLSISRQLAKLLGGSVTVDSEEGKGSRFTLTIPQELSALDEPAPEPASQTPPVPFIPPSRSISLEDDREHLSPGARVILVIEDDESFSRILFDMAHDHGLDCVVASTAEEGLRMA
ncbi:MAG TPA: CHASE3 domain-containing protein, partial [Fimbriimonas sp.]|nr:CHASE3 domain-containing protein [Fimbriimonas sp.]